MPILVLLSSTPAALRIRYVRPDSPHSGQCPGQPCLTLDQYRHAADAHFKNETNFVFLAGNHTLQDTINLSNVSGLVLRGDRYESGDSILRCNNVSCFTFDNVMNLTIEGLTFILDLSKDSTAMIVLKSSVSISSSTFIGRNSLKNGTSFGAITLVAANLTIAGCHFEGNRARHGAAIYVSVSSSLVLGGSTFVANEASAGFGGAIFANNSAVTLNGTAGNTFVHNLAQVGGAICARNSTISVGSDGGGVLARDMTFLNNTAGYGGAIYLNRSMLSLGGENITFDSNSALSGGAVYMQKSSLLSNTAYLLFRNNTALTDNGGALLCIDSSLSISGARATFEHNSAACGGGMFIQESSISCDVRMLLLQNNTAWSVLGGALVLANSNGTLGHRNTSHFFLDNHSSGGNGIGGASGIGSGGAIGLYQGNFTIDGDNYFQRNITLNMGGAVTVFSAGLTMPGRAFFDANVAYLGGSLAIWGRSHVVLNGTTFHFNNSIATRLGGAIYVITNAILIMRADDIHLVNNSARETGEGIFFFANSRLIAEATHFHFVRNSAKLGGRMHSQTNNEVKLTSAVFINNTASSGGTMFITEEKSFSVYNISLIGNSNIAFSVWRSNLSVGGVSKFCGNYGRNGGAMRIQLSTAIFSDSTHYERNKGILGGAISVYDSKLFFSDETLFSQNTADNSGGALYAQDSEVTINHTATAEFEFNLAKFGGAMFFGTTSKLNVEPFSNLVTSHNFASDYGGAIYHEDSVTPYQCSFSTNDSQYIDDTVELLLPYCFLNLKELSNTSTAAYTVSSFGDSAGIDGIFSTVVC